MDYSHKHISIEMNTYYMLLLICNKLYSIRTAEMDIEQQDVLSQEPVIEDLEDEIGIPTVLLYETDAPIESSEDLPISTKEGNKFSLIQFLGRISINLILPFINGMMLGFGELIAHEIGFHYNWVGARVYPTTRVTNRKTQLL